MSDLSISATSTNLQTCFSENQLNGLTLKNRFIKAGTFENMTPNGVPGEKLLKFHSRFAQGGIAMTTLGYCAVEPNGRLKENMMVMNENIREPLTHVISQLHALGTKVSGQMGHCGGFTENTQLTYKRAKGASKAINKLGFAKGLFFCDAMTLQDIDELVQHYKSAASFMKSVGFDAVEIHMGHGYGLCQFMSPLTNKRKDEYGGSLQNRMRLPLRVLAAVREALGEQFPILVKISITEGVKGGLHYDDAVEISKLLDQNGVDAIVTSGGSSVNNPMIMFRGRSMLPALLKHEPSRLMKMLMRLAAPKMFRAYPYKELYFLEHAKRINDAVNCSVVYIGGANSNENFATLMDAGFDYIQLGRSLLSDPDLPNSAQADVAFSSKCVHCNECVGTIAHPEGIHCTRFL